MIRAMYEYEYPHPAVTTDCVIFSIRDEQLHVLLIKRGDPPYKGGWAFPGGFIEIDEDLETAARRELEEETGLTGMELEQLHTFGNPDRDPRERVISVVYIGVVSADQVELRAGDDADEAEWFAIDELPELAFDHDEVLALAYERVVADIVEA